MQLALRLLWREWRSGDLLVFCLAVLLSTTIICTLGFFSASLKQALTLRSHDFLAADRVLRSAYPLAPQWLAQATELGLAQAQTLEFMSMLLADDRMQLASIKAVSSEYPLRGRVKIQPAGAGRSPALSTAAPAEGEIWLEQRLLSALQLRLGDRVQVGEVSLRVAAVLLSEPDRGSSLISIAPRALMHLSDVAATEVIQPGSRLQYRYLFAGAAPVLERFQRQLTPLLQDGQRWLGLIDSQPRIGRALRRIEDFLSLASVLGAALGGVATALAARRFAARHSRSVAILKTHGLRARTIVQLYSVQFAALLLPGLLLGALLGYVLQQSLLALLAQRYPDLALPGVFSLAVIGMAGLASLICLLCFALWPLAALGRCSTLQVLGRQEDSAIPAAWPGYALGLLATLLLILLFSSRWQLAAAIAAGLSAVLILLLILSALLLSGLLRLQPNGRALLRLALASLRHKRFFYLLQITAFALALMLLLLVVLLRSSLVEDWRAQLPATAPNHFLINIGAAQKEAIEQWFEQRSLKREPLYPVVRGRLLAINDEPLSAVLQRPAHQQARGSVERELNLTWSSSLPPGNQLLRGVWWDALPSATAIAPYQPVSIEAGLAERLGIGLGDSLIFRVAGEELAARVSSIRQLNWDSMQPNFFMIFPPQSLSHLPLSYITSFYLPQDRKAELNRLLQRWPTVSVIELDVIIEQIQQMIAHLALAVEGVLALVAVAALLVLVAGIRLGQDARRREMAQLRVLGASQRQLSAALLGEYALVGALAGLCAALGAEAALALLQHYVFSLPVRVHYWLWLIGPVTGVVLLAVLASLSSVATLRASPLMVLQRG